MNSAPPTTTGRDVQLSLRVAGVSRILRGVGRFSTDPQLGEILKVALDDPAGGNPELSFQVAQLTEAVRREIRKATSIRLHLDGRTGEWRFAG